LLNYLLATAKKPQISLWDGIVMGGGVGISVHGKYRIATENTVFAMPETKLGFFPDVGSMYWMPRLLQPSVAVFLALTGHRLDAADLLYAGIATHYVPSNRLDDLEAALVEATSTHNTTDELWTRDHSTEDLIALALESFTDHAQVNPEQSFLAQKQSSIDHTFDILNNNTKGVEDIVQELQQMDSPFGTETLQVLQSMSATSLKVTLEGLRRGLLAKDIGEDLQMEFRMAQAFVREGSDFSEGVRATLVDKDGKPQWNPKTLEEVAPERVAMYFEPIENEWVIPSNMAAAESHTPRNTQAKM
jgi:enoyl-CoA hydratase/carnithine racemase